MVKERVSVNRVISSQQHIPVMLEECLQTLSPENGKVYLDGTFGAGGYSRAILQAAECKVYAIDRDPDAYARACEFAKEFPGRFVPLKGCFGDMKSLLHSAGVKTLDGIVLDVGVSSIQIDNAERGFSFNKDAALDMRMSMEGETAADAVNSLSEEDLANVIYNYGEERASRKIAKRIVEFRQTATITTTKQLADIVHSVLPKRHDKKTDTATKTFQALRIYVNDELAELEKALDAAEELLNNEGKLVIVSFHSLEDSIVKNFLKTKTGRDITVSRHMPMVENSKTVSSFRLEKTGVVKPSDKEVAANPRARSARLRYAIRTIANLNSQEAYHA